MSEKKYVVETHVGRKQSPAVEKLVQDELRLAVRKLVESCGIYQNVTIPKQCFLNLADEDYSTEDLAAEFRRRPIRVVSQSFSGGVLGVGTQPLGTPANELVLSFYLPNVQLECSKCRNETTFQSMKCSCETGTDGSYKCDNEIAEQVFDLSYRCSNCSGCRIAFLVLRRGLKLQLVGRSVPYRPKVAPEWPKEVRDVISDACAAVAENDVAAAYYHLRTGLEFLIKNELGIDLKEKIEGSQLCERYNMTLDERLKTGFPSLQTIFSRLSSGLHSRDVSRDEFNELQLQAVDHLKAKALFKQYSE